MIESESMQVWVRAFFRESAAHLEIQKMYERGLKSGSKKAVTLCEANFALRDAVHQTALALRERGGLLLIGGGK